MYISKTGQLFHADKTPYTDVSYINTFQYSDQALGLVGLTQETYAINRRVALREKRLIKVNKNIDNR